MQGDLVQANVAELLLHLHQSGRTGILRFSQGEIKKGIYFKDGAIVFAHSNVKTDRLGETLLRLGKITEEEFKIASVEVIESGKRLGRTLHEKGFLSEAEVMAGVSYQLQQIVYSVFNWDRGEYEFVDRERPVYEDIMVDISTPDLLIEGIRHITNPIVLQRVTGSDESLIVERVNEETKLPRTSLDFAEETVLGCLGEKSRIGRLRTLSHLAQLEFGRTIFALLLTGMLRIRPASAEEKAQKEQPIQKKKKPSFTTQPMSFLTRRKGVKPPSRQLKTISEADMRRRIVNTEMRFHDITDEEVLGVLPDCTREEIQKAYDKQVSIFHPPLYSEERYKDLKDRLKFISERLANAYDRLLENAATRLPFSPQALQQIPPAPSEPGTIIVAKPQQEMESMSQPVASVSSPPLLPVAEPEKPKEPTVGELEEKLRVDPGNTEVLRQLAKALLKDGKPQEGEKVLLRALEVEPQSIENHFALAELYHTLGLRMQAFKHLNIVLQLQPDNQRAMEMLDVKKRKPLYEISRES